MIVKTIQTFLVWLLVLMSLQTLAIEYDNPSDIDEAAL